MNESNFALALDAGTTRLTAATATFEASRGVHVSPFALGRDRADVAAVAFVTEEGDVVFGEDAALLGRDRPQRLVREFTRSIGDRMPLIVGGYAVDAAELFARLVCWSVAVASAAFGARPAGVAVTHPTGWGGHRVACVRTALHAQGLDDVLLVPSAVVAAERSTDAGRGRLIGMYDLGGSTFEASVLRGTQVLGTPSVTDIGGQDLDHALMQHVLESVGAAVEPAADTEPAAAARDALVAAKETLSFRADAAMPMSIDGRDLDVRLTRFELDAVAAALVERTVDALELALDSAQVSASELDEIVLIGGASRTPLIAQKVSERFDRPIIAADDPQFTAVLGAADAAWARLERLRPAVIEDPAAPDAVAGARRERPHPAHVLRRLPYGAAAALAAGAVLVAAGVVFGSATPVADGTGSAQDPVSESDGDRAGSARPVRIGAGYSTGVLVDTDQAIAAETPRRDAADDDIREPKPRTPQPPESTPPPPRTGGAGGPAAPSGSSSVPDSPITDPDPVDSTPTGAGPQPEPTTEPEPTTQPEPTTEPEPTTQPDPPSIPAPEPTSEPTPDPAPEPEPAPSEPAPEPATSPSPEEAPPSSADPPPDTTAP
jgi:actin-like ATPase involved in cell morphogenesis